MGLDEDLDRPLQGDDPERPRRERQTRDPELPCLGDEGDRRRAHLLRSYHEGDCLEDDLERFLNEYLSVLDRERDLNARGGVLTCRRGGGVLDILFLDGDREGDRFFCGCISLPTGDLEEEWEGLRLSLPVHFLASRFGDSGDCCLLAGDAIRRIGGGSGLVTFSEGFDR